MKSLSIESFHTVLFCCRWDACVAFYQGVLGFPVVDQKPGFVEFEVTPCSRIGLIKSSGKAVSKKNGSSLVLSFRIGNIEEIHKILLMKCGKTSDVKQHPWGARVFEVRDPEGRRLEFWAPQL